MSHFDRLILAVVLALGLTIAGLSVAAARLGPAVDHMSTLQTLDGTSVNTEIGVTFTEPMNGPSVERSFRIHPRVAGDFFWAGNQLFYSPRHTLAYGTYYRVTIGTEAMARGGRHLTRPFRGSFTTQSRHLMYLGSQGDDAGRLVLASVNGSGQVVGPQDGRITSYSLSFDHSLAVYVKRGAPGERPDELWLLSLADNSTQRIFRRADWNISQPHFSPDGRDIVFLATNVLLCQPYYGCYRDRSGPVIYFFDLRTHRVSPFKSRSDVPITDFIDFSPAGQIAYTDMGSALTLADLRGEHIIHIPNSGNSLEFWGFDTAGDKAEFVGQTPSSSGGDILVYWHNRYTDVSRGVYDSSAPALSTTGDRIAYAGYRGERGIEPIYGINVYSFRTRTTQHLTEPGQWSDWSPAWSGDDRYVAFVRSQPQEAMYMGAGEIWIIRSNGQDARPLGGVGTNVQWVS